MATWLKVVLILGGLVVVLVLVTVVAGVYMVNRYGPEMVEAGKQTFAEGQEYGRRTDNEGCLNEAVARHNRSDGFTGMIKTNLFLKVCLDASRPTPAFCDSVPRQTEFVKSAQWQLQQCGRYNLKTENQCGQLFQQVQQFCEGRRGGTNANEWPSSPPAPDEPAPPPPAPRAPRPSSDNR
ncbi:MAG: hypothetical protein H7Z38_16005 [Rubrivivax sp.]|nr:hypothetical protein [Pyrinomonadaceae bacterium]